LENSLTEIVLTKTDLQELEKIKMKNILITEDLPYEMFQTLATLRALQILLKRQRINPQFEIELGEDRRPNIKNEVL